MSGLEAQSMDPEVAREAVRIILIRELYDQVSQKDIKLRNPHVELDDLIDRYVLFLKQTKDPNAKDIERICSLDIEADQVDNVLESIQADRVLRSQIQESLKHGGVNLDTAKGDKIDPLKLTDFTNHLRSFSDRELLIAVSQKAVPKWLRLSANTSLAVNLALMMGQRSETVTTLANEIRDRVGVTAEIPMVTITDATTALVVGLFILEGGLKAGDVGLKCYLRDNKFDATLNALGIADMGILLAGGHESYGAVARGARALRGLKFFTKIKTVREMLEALKEAGPSLANLSAMYVGLSSIITLMLVELLGSNAEEFKDMESAFSQMLSLFYGDGFQDVMTIIDESTEDNLVKELVAKSGVLGYMATSVIGAIGVFQAIIINQVIGTDKVERMVAYSSEKTSEGLSAIKKAVEEIKNFCHEILTAQKEIKAELAALKAVVDSREDRERRIDQVKQRSIKKS